LFKLPKQKKEIWAGSFWKPWGETASLDGPDETWNLGTAEKLYGSYGQDEGGGLRRRDQGKGNEEIVRGG